MLKHYLPGLIRIGVALILIYAAFLLFVFLGQRQMLYVPTRKPLEVLLGQARQLGLEPWRNSAGNYIGWMHRTSSTGTCALVIHGNAGSAINRSYYVDGLTHAGFSNVFILEFPGYGARPGSPSQKTCCEAATQALECLEKEGPVYVVGESIGTGVAAYAAGECPKKVAGVLLVTPYHDMTEVAKFHMPLVPARLLLRDRYPSAEYLKSYQGPLAVLLAENDTIIPNRFGRELYDCYSGPKKLWIIPQTGHNDVAQRPPAWWREVRDFWQAPVNAK